MGIHIDIKKRLGDFNLEIEFKSDARRIGILGASGCGKSLTLKSIAGIEKPDNGHISIDDRILYDSSEKINLKPQKRNVGYMFQNYALFPTMNVAENIAAGLKASSDTKATDRAGSTTGERVEEMVERFSLRGLEKHFPAQLSGGQQQRVALARIMAYSPDLIMLDEPFSALDQHLKERLQHEMMRMLEDYEGQIIMVSHSRDELYRFSEELLIMDNGRIIGGGKTQQIFDDPGTGAIARMTGCKNITPATRKDAHSLDLPQWGVEIKLEREIPENICAIGYRAHFFDPVWGEKDKNCIDFRLSGVDELPFERRYYIEPAPGSETSEKICWFVQNSDRLKLDRDGCPDYLRLREDAVMMLTDM